MPNYAVLLTVIPPVLAAVKTVHDLRSEVGREGKTLERLAAIRASAPETAHPDLDQLTTELAAVYKYKELRRVGRKFDGVSIATLVFLTIIASTAIFFVLTLDNTLVRVGLGIFAALCLLLMTAGVADVVKYPALDRPKALTRVETASSKPSD